MNNDLLVSIVIIMAIIGVIVALVVGMISYKEIKKADLSGKYKDYLLQPLSNTDFSIGEAVKYLKIVNASKKVENKDE